MLNSAAEDTKYLVIVRGEDISSSVPGYLKGKFAIHWTGGPDDPTKRNELVSAIVESYDVPEISEVTFL